MLQAPAMQAGCSRGIYAPGAEHDAVHGVTFSRSDSNVSI